MFFHFCYFDRFGDFCISAFPKIEMLGFGAEMLWLGVEMLWFGVVMLWFGVEMLWFGVVMLCFGVDNPLQK